MKIVRWLNVILLSASLGACASAGGSGDFVPTSAPADTTSVPGDYTLSAGDLLEISVFEVPDLTREVHVDDAGAISLPLIGDVKAAGYTAHALEMEIAAKLRAKYLQSPQVSVFVKKAAGEQVTVSGEVNRPGVYPISGQMTLIQALAQSGDFTDVGDPASVRVFRQNERGRQMAKFNIEDIRSGKAADPYLHAGDLVVVDSSGGRTAWKTAKDIMAPVLGPAAVAATVIK